jgi:hypothetical protein
MPKNRNANELLFTDFGLEPFSVKSCKSNPKPLSLILAQGLAALSVERGFN